MELSSAGFTMTHAAFAGAALGLVLGIDPMYSAMGVSVLVAAGLGPVAEQSKLPPNVILGITFPLTMALALILLNFAPDTAMSSTALSLLWGSVLGMTMGDVLHIGILAFVMILLVTVFFKEFQSIVFDRKLAESSGINTKPFFYAILFLTGITVSLSLKLVGGLLVFALMINPSSAAYQFFYDIKKILLISPLFGAVFAFGGLYLSFLVDFPVGASIALVSTMGFAGAVLLSPKRRRG